jgi:hypothetical protein
VVFTSSLGELGGQTVVAEGGLTKAERQGQAIAACWLLGPDAILLPSDEQMRATLAREDVRKVLALAERNPQLMLRLCAIFVKALERGGRVDTQPARVSATGCRARRLTITSRRRVVAARPPRGAVGYGCTATGGKMKITVKGRLRERLGKRLDLAVVREPEPGAPRAKLTFGFRSG